MDGWKDKWIGGWVVVKARRRDRRGEEQMIE